MPVWHCLKRDLNLKTDYSNTKIHFALFRPPLPLCGRGGRGVRLHTPSIRVQLADRNFDILGGGSSILEILFASATFFNRIPSYFFASAYQQTKQWVKEYQIRKIVYTRTRTL